MEHLRHFGLSEDPFRDELRVRDFCETRVAREALLRVERGLRQGRGLGLVSGAPGSGKSMLLRRILEGLEEEVFEASMLVVLPGAAGAGGLLVRFARHLGVDAPSEERQTLLGQIFEQLAIVREEGRQAVLLVDDADVLGSSGALAELIGLLRLEYEDRRLLSLVLAGSSGLDAAIAGDRALAHRVDFRGRLGALDPEESALYLAHRIRKSGGDPALLSPEVVAAIHGRGRGLPGLMNRLADNALFEAFLCGRRRVSRADVERAYQDLGFDAPPAAPGAALAPEPASAPEGRPEDAADAPEIVEEDALEVALEPFASDDGSLGDLDSELEAIFEGVDAPAAAGPPRARGHRRGPPMARLLDD